MLRLVAAAPLGRRVEAGADAADVVGVDALEVGVEPVRAGVGVEPEQEVGPAARADGPGAEVEVPGPREPGHHGDLEPPDLDGAGDVAAFEEEEPGLAERRLERHVEDVLGAVDVPHGLLVVDRLAVRGPRDGVAVAALHALGERERVPQRAAHEVLAPEPGKAEGRPVGLDDGAVGGEQAREL